MTVEEAPREAIASYLVFRHVGRAVERGALDPSSGEALALDLRERVQGCWEELFGDRVDEARRWAVHRTNHLVKLGILEPEAAETLLNRIREKMPPRSPAHGPPPGPPPQDPAETALMFLWKIHVLYLELTEAIDAGQLEPRSRDAVAAALHDHALLVLSRMSEDTRTGLSFFTGTLERSREIVREMGALGLIGEESRAYLEEALSPVRIESRSPTVATCRVCGTGLEGIPSISCRGCETPHHQDCWEFNGGCSTFACLSREGRPL